MFKVNFDDRKVATIEAKVRKDVKEILSSSAVMNEVGEMVVERLKYQARTESPFNQSGDFPPLKSSTVKRREYLAKHNKTHETFEVSRSNLTITGEFLNSLTYWIKGPALLEIFFDGMHSPYYGEKGPISKPVANQNLFKWLTQKGFAVFDKSLQENKTIKSRIRTIVLRYVRRGLKVRNALDQ